MRWLLLPALLVAASAPAIGAPPLPADASDPLEAGQQAVVSADGDPLNLRTAPTLRADVIRRLPDGSTVTAVGEQRQADGYAWEQVDADGDRGWVAALYLEAVDAGNDGDPPTSTEASDSLQAGEQAVVRADGDCLALRTEPTRSAASVSCLAEGTTVTALGEQRQADELTWELVAGDGRQGWVAALYLEAVGGEDNGDTTAPTTGARLLPVPPRGGLTLGIAGTSDVEALIAAQTFGVSSVWLYRIATQDYLRYIPDAPAMVNTLDSSSLTPESIVMLRRSGERADQSAERPRAPDEAVRGTPNVLPSPPSEGLTVGISGTNDPVALADAQPFEVRMVAFLHVPTQLQLVYIPGAPAFVQSLARGVLEPDSVVWMRAGSVPPAPGTTPTTSGTVVDGRLTYYYCNQGTIAVGIGDGGGWCGAMANGQIVYAGAAACARENLGQRFRILGDPLDRTYTCADTGSAVHGNHRDIWFDNSDDGLKWSQQVGESGRIEILSEE